MEERMKSAPRVRTPLGQLIWSVRTENGWSYSAMAEKIEGVDAATLWRWEKTAQRPQRAKLEALAEGLRYPLEELLALLAQPIPVDVPAPVGEMEVPWASLIFSLQHRQPSTVEELTEVASYLAHFDFMVMAAALSCIANGARTPAPRAAEARRRPGAVQRFRL